MIRSNQPSTRPAGFLHSKKGRRAVLLSTAALLLTALVLWVIQTNTVPALTRITVTVSASAGSADELPAAFEGFRIAQVSDLHDAELGDNHARTVALLREAEPDVILLTGDLIDGHEERTDVALTVAFAEQAVAIAPCYYVTGNHEGRIPAETYRELEDALTALGVTVLHNEAVTLTRDGDTVTLVGIDSPAFGHGDTAAETPTLSELCPEDGFVILLAHHPEFFADYAAGADLVFSGHAHGGQFRLPFIGGVYAPGQGWFPAYDAGLYTETTDDGHTARMVVSRGLGNSGIPLRLGNRPEVVVVTLTRGEG